MQDKEYMEGILWDSKCLCDLFLHGSIESSTVDVHTLFESALEETLKIQNEIYNTMNNMGWYPTENVEQKKIDKVRKKYEKETKE